MAKQVHRIANGEFPRRRFIQTSGLGALTASLPGLLQSQGLAGPSTDSANTHAAFGKAKQVILLFLSGGPPQHETFDPKPLAPLEIRGPFKPIQTNVSGIHFSELLPRTAAQADRLAVIRSMYTNNHIHGGSGYWVLTGQPMLTGDGEVAQPTDWPNLASIVKRFRPSERIPALTSVTLPELFIGNGGNIESGQFGGILGPQFSPELIECRPAEVNSPLGGLYACQVSTEQMRQRIGLLDSLGISFDRVPRGASVHFHDVLNRQAFELMTTGAARNAFRLDEESDKTRDRYGRQTWGQSVLLARRLIEAGVRFVTVNWPRVPGDRGVDNPVWDTHARNFDRMEDCLAPQFDVGYTALLDDLAERGLLDETLVIAVGEFGRTPTVNANAGRDHWGSVFSCVLAGGGIAGGQIFGSSDREGGYPDSDAVSAGHLASTVFHLAGIDTQRTFHDRQGRELPVTHCEPLYKLLGDRVPSSKLVEPAGDLAFVPAYRDGLLLHPDFSQSYNLLDLTAPASPKGWRAHPIVADTSKFGVWLSPGLSATAAIGIGNLENTTAIAPGANAVIAQQIRDPQSGHFTAHLKVRGGGTNPDAFQALFTNHYRCRLVLFQFTRPDKSATERMELASTEFVPNFSPDAHSEDWQTVTVEKRMAPVPGVNFTFGLGMGVAVLIEQKIPGEIKLEPQRGSAYVSIKQIQIDFQGWKMA